MNKRSNQKLISSIIILIFLFCSLYVSTVSNGYSVSVASDQFIELTMGETFNIQSLVNLIVKMVSYSLEC